MRSVLYGHFISTTPLPITLNLSSGIFLRRTAMVSGNIKSDSGASTNPSRDDVTYARSGSIRQPAGLIV